MGPVVSPQAMIRSNRPDHRCRNAQGREEAAEYMKFRTNQKGAAMIMVLCMMALITALSLSLLLTASVVFSSARNEWDREQCRILAVSLSQELEKDLQSTTGGANSLRACLEEKIKDGSWVYYNEDERGHTSRYADWNFALDWSKLSDEVKQQAGITGKEAVNVLIHWEGTKDIPEELMVKVTVQRSGLSGTITSEYHYSDPWSWTLSGRE